MKSNESKVANNDIEIENTLAKPKRERKETQKLKEYKSALIEVQKTESKPRVKKSKTSIIQEEVYIVEALLEKKGSKFLVKWENYNNDWNSWEPKAGLPAFIVKVC